MNAILAMFTRLRVGWCRLKGTHHTRLERHDGLLHYRCDGCGVAEPVIVRDEDEQKLVKRLIQRRKRAAKRPAVSTISATVVEFERRKKGA